MDINKYLDERFSAENSETVTIEKVKYWFKNWRLQELMWKDGPSLPSKFQIHDVVIVVFPQAYSLTHENAIGYARLHAKVLRVHFGSGSKVSYDLEITGSELTGDDYQEVPEKRSYEQAIQAYKTRIYNVSEYFVQKADSARAEENYEDARLKSIDIN